MRLVDTHAHLDFPAFDTDRTELIEKLSEKEIGVITIATDQESVVKVDQLSREHSLVWGAIGLHPTEIGNATLAELPRLITNWHQLIAANKKIVAIGEIGLDYFHDRETETASRQKAALRMMLTFATEEKLPVIFHCRDAYGDLLTMLSDYPSIRGVVHCFSGDQEQAERFLGLGLSLSATAIVTYSKNGSLAEVFHAVPEDRLLVETDSPFLPSTDNRGGRNDPMTVEKVVEFLAERRHVSPAQLAEQTTANATKLFNLSP